MLKLLQLNVILIGIIVANGIAYYFIHSSLYKQEINLLNFVRKYLLSIRDVDRLCKYCQEINNVMILLN